MQQHLKYYLYDFQNYSFTWRFWAAKSLFVLKYCEKEVIDVSLRPRRSILHVFRPTVDTIVLLPPKSFASVAFTTAMCL